MIMRVCVAIRRSLLRGVGYLVGGIDRPIREGDSLVLIPDDLVVGSAQSTKILYSIHLSPRWGFGDWVTIFSIYRPPRWG